MGSGATTVITLLDKPRSNPERLFELRHLRDGEHIFFIAIHPALKDTLIGLNAVFVDALLIGPPKDGSSLLNRSSAFSGHVYMSKSSDKAITAPVRGYNDIQTDKDKSANAAGAIIEELRSYGFDGYIMTDVRSDFRFAINGSALLLTGNPLYYFWEENERGIINEATKLNESIADYERLLAGL